MLPPGRRPLRPWRLLAAVIVIALLVTSVAGGLLLWHELNTSRLQAREIARYAARLDYQRVAGPSDAIRFPAHGPFDQRLGYTELPRFAERLQARGFALTEQVRFNDALIEHVEHGLFPPYAEKTRAGLDVFDCRAQPLYGFRYPWRGYARFEDVPPIVAQALLFIENRDLLDESRPTLNPAVDWVRFARAALGQLGRMVNADLDAPGGSTLATQIEKYRHSPGGITLDAREKLRQMVSASVRAYREGEQTLPVRRRLVLDYLNTVPLSAAPGHGEVNGLGDGLWVWFGADFERVNALLSAAEGEGAERIAQGQALRQVVALMIAHRRPSWYLAGGRGELTRSTDSHLRLLAEAGLISPALRDAALGQPLVYRDLAADPAVVPANPGKGTTAVRARLAGMLGTSLYSLDRLDAQMNATLHGGLQQAVSDHQRHHLAQGLPLLDARGTLDLGRGQQRIDALEIGTEPHPQPVAQAIDLAMAGRGRQRHGVEVVEHQAAADRQRLLTLAVGAHRGRHHLAQLLARIQGDAAGRMTVLLDLGGERAAAGGVEIGIDHAPDLTERRARKAHPVHRRVQRRSRFIEQVAVLDEQQGLGDDRGHVLEAFVATPGVTEAVQRLRAAVEDVEPGARLLGVGREQAVLDVLDQRVVEAHLLGEREATRLQALGKTRQLGVAEALIERAMRRKADRVARARHARKVEARGVACDLARLQPGRVQFVPKQHAAGHACHQKQDDDDGGKEARGAKLAVARGQRGCRPRVRGIGIQGWAGRYCIAAIIPILRRKNDTVTSAPQPRRDGRRRSRATTGAAPVCQHDDKTARALSRSRRARASCLCGGPGAPSGSSTAGCRRSGDRVRRSARGA